MEYYFEERLHILQCLKFLLSYWQDPRHPYRVIQCTVIFHHSTHQFCNKILQYLYFSVISGLLHKTVHPFRNFRAVLPPPTLYKVETQYTRPTLFWGEGRGWTCVNWKMPQKCRSAPRRLSRIVRGSLWIPLLLWIHLFALLANKDISKPSLWRGGRRDGRTSQKDKPAFDFVFKPDIVGRCSVG